MTDDLRKVLADVANDPKAPAGARVKAATALLPRKAKPDAADQAPDTIHPAVAWLNARRGPDSIPTECRHRGLALHDGQDAGRIEIVKQAIDDVLAAPDLLRLVDYAGDTSRPPEARSLAAARIEVAWTDAAAGREIRPRLSISDLRAAVAGIDSVTWRSPSRYCCLFDNHHGRAAPRLMVDKVSPRQLGNSP